MEIKNLKKGIEINKNHQNSQSKTFIRSSEKHPKTAQNEPKTPK